MNVKISAEKISHLQALADSRGVIAAAAMDQRGSLRKAIAAAKGGESADITDEVMVEFKSAVSKALTPHASAILLDPQWGLPAAEARAPDCGLLLAYEKSGYDNTQPGRLPELLPDYSVRSIQQAGADAVKVLVYYTPFEKPEINDRKRDFIERIGAECAAAGLPFFLELVGYDVHGEDAKGPEFAKRKPEVVVESIQEFSDARYQADALKVEIPVNMQFADGSVARGDNPPAYSKSQALEHFREAAEVAQQPFIYLSAGVDNDVFTEALEWAGEAGVQYAGVLCGRATWKDGVAVYAEKGVAALEDWLTTVGVKNIQAVNEALRTASSWYGFYGADTPEALADEAGTGPR